MRAISKIRQIINPPYSSKDLLVIFGTLIILVAVPFTIFLSLQRPSLTPRAASSATFKTTASGDWRVSRLDTQCPAVDDASTTGNQATLDVGQTRETVATGIDYEFQRSLLSFDTSSLPDDAIIESAALYLTVDFTDEIGRSFTVNVLRSPWGPPPATKSDWDSPEISVDGTLSVSPSSPPEKTTVGITLNIAGVNKTGRTEYKLRSSREGIVCPSGLENIAFYAADSSSGATKGPNLVVAYQTPTPPTPPTPTPPSSGGGGKTTGGGNSGGKKTSGGGGGTLDSLQIEISVPYLVGSLKAKADVGGVSKDIEISGGNKSYTLDLKGSNLSLNKEYNLVITAGKTLVRKTKFTPTTSSTTVKVADLILGDLNQDNTIDSTDQISLLRYITSQTPAGDLNADTSTNSMDWAILLTGFGKKGD